MIGKEKKCTRPKFSFEAEFRTQIQQSFEESNATYNRKEEQDGKA